jgi:dTMP kinase
VAAPSWLIALEGIDGAGITTQARRLVAWLEAQGRPARYAKQPSGGPFGVLLRQVLTGALRRRRADGGEEPFDEATLALAFAADRLDHLATEIGPALAAGAIVVCDRYVLSSLAYQGRVLGIDWVEALNARCRWPDLTLYLDVPVEVSLARMAAAGRARERYEERATLDAVRAGFARGIERLRQAGQRVVVINGAAPIDAVEQAIRAAVQALLARDTTSR